MNTTQFQHAFDKNWLTKRLFLGVYARDQLDQLQLSRLPCALVVNTDVASGPGEHWVCIYVDSLGRGEYFDSYGREPLKQVENLFKKNNIINYTYNGTPLQAVGSIVCGQYCLYYLTRRILCDESLYSIVKKLLGVNGPFIRDNYVNEYVRKYYKIVQTAYTVHVFIQLCKPFIM
jgi:hypothetical protein